MRYILIVVEEQTREEIETTLDKLEYVKRPNSAKTLYAAMENIKNIDAYEFTGDKE